MAFWKIPWKILHFVQWLSRLKTAMSFGWCVHGFQLPAPASDRGCTSAGTKALKEPLSWMPLAPQWPFITIGYPYHPVLISLWIGEIFFGEYDEIWWKIVLLPLDDLFRWGRWGRGRTRRFGKGFRCAGMGKWIHTMSPLELCKQIIIQGMLRSLAGSSDGSAL